MINAQSGILRMTEKKISVLDGLPNRHINTTFIDKQNRIWCTVDNQLAKYEFGKIKSQIIAPIFSNRGFNFIAQDSKNNLWISECVEWFFPFNIVRTVIFNPTTQKTILLNDYIGKKLNIHSLLADSLGNMYIGTKNGEIYIFDAQKKQLLLSQRFENLPIKLVYIGTKGMAFCLEKNSKEDKKIIYFSNDKKIKREENLTKTFVRSVIETENDLVALYHRGSSKIKLVSLINNKYVDFTSAKDSYLWNITYDKTKQLFLLNESNSIIFLDKNFKKTSNESFDFLIHDIWIDHANNYFLSTNNGVYIINLSKRKISNYLKNNELDKINENYSCRAVLRVNVNQVLLNTNKKRQLIDIKTKKIRQLNESKKVDNRFYLSTLKAPNNEVYFGEDCLIKTNLKNNKEETLCRLDTTKIWALENYKTGILLGLEKKGIVFYNKTNKKSTVFSETSDVFNNAIVYDFYTQNNSIYIAAENGFYVLRNEKTLTKINFPINSKNQYACFHVNKDSKNANQLLIATSNGLWIFDLLSQKLSQFVKESQLLTKKFLSIYRTKNGVWSSSEEGVWHFDDKGNLLKIYTQADGLTSNECNRQSHFQDEEDNLYFGGINGLNVLNPKDFSKKTEQKYVIRFDSIKIYSKNQLTRFFTDSTPAIINLERDEQGLDLGLAYEDYKYECPKQYYYRTNKAINQDWQVLPDRHLILNNIEPGKNIIEIKAVSCSDFINSQVISITIIRKPQLYQEWYFLILVLMFFGMITWLVTKFSNYQLKKRNELLQKKVDEQTQSLRESLELKETILGILVHDVRYPILSFYDITRKLDYLIKKQDLERLNLLGKETESRSRKVLWLIDELVYWVKSTNKNWKADKEEKLLNKIIIQIFESYQEELNEKGLRFQIDNADFLTKVDVGLMVIILRNIIFNAIIHAKTNSTITIKIHELENLRMKVEIINEMSQKDTEKFKGLGLGLTLLMPILKKSNIELSNHSEGGIYFANIVY